MSRPVVIPAVEIAEVISKAVMRYAREMEALLTVSAPLRKAASDVQLRELMTMFELPEAMQILRLVGEMRIRCACCNRGFSYVRASGNVCLGCAAELRAARESC